MREIVLDTETTGLSVEQGHRIIEIGALELVNMVPTGQNLHLYINPERLIDEDAIKIHGITDAFVADKPLFADIAQQFLDFVQGDPIIIHNAPFDTGFLNAELARVGLPLLEKERIIDTLVMARRKYPGAQASLDALCRRFDIDNTHRDLHGALIDADLLAAVYVEMKGGLQPSLLSDGQPQETQISAGSVDSQITTQAGLDNSSDLSALSGFHLDEQKIRAVRPPVIDDTEKAAHEAFLAQMKDPIWLRSSD